MHIYPQDYKSSMLKQWIDNAIEFGDWSVDLRFIVPNEMHNIKTKYNTQLDSAQNLLGEISQTIMENDFVNGSITLVGLTATIYITTV